MFDMIDRFDLPKDVDFVMAGIPSEATSTSPRAGTKGGPASIRKAFDYFSMLTETGFDIFKKRIVDVGDIEIYPTLVEETMSSIENLISSILSVRQDNPPVPVILGGDHFITYPIIRSCLKSLPHKFGLIVFDAHVDLYDQWLYKEPYAHCTVFHRILDLPSIDKNDLLFIGTRDVDYEEADFLKNNSITPLSAYSITQQELEAVLLPKLQLFKEQNIEHVYVSIDIDVLDPSCAPGTGYPIPGGLSYRQLWNCLQIIPRHFNVIGFDVVEVCPLFDASEITAIVAARLIMEFLGSIIKNMQ